MAFWLRHKFQSGKADGTNVTVVKPSNWNADHDINMDEGTIIGRPPGAGEGPAGPIPISSIYFPGMIVAYGGGTAPTGWFLCNGQSLTRADNAALFAIIGTAYGAVDGSHFSVPDLRGRVPAGVDGTGRLTGATVTNPHLVGGAGGQETEQAYADVNVTAAGRSYGQTGGEAITAHVWGSTAMSGNGWGGSYNSGALQGDHAHSLDVWGNAYGVQSAWADGNYSGGGGGYTRAVTNVQPTLMVNYIIKA